MSYASIKCLIAGALVPAMIIIPFGTHASAAARPASAQTTVRNLIVSMKGLTEAKTPSQREAIFATVNRSLAMERLARESLGSEWGKLNPSQRKHFVALFTEAMEKLAYPRVARALNKISITYLGERAKPSGMLVRTKVTRPDGGAMPVDYTLADEHDRWTIIDVTLDGESLAKAVHTRIQRALSEKGYKGLVADLEQHMKEAKPTGTENHDTTSPSSVREPDAIKTRKQPSETGAPR